MSNLEKSLKIKGDTFEFIGEEMVIYIPDDYFESGLAANYGSYVSLFALVEIELFAKGKSLGREILNIPTVIEIFPSTLEPVTMSLTGKDVDKEKYQVAKFLNGDTFTRTAVRQSNDYAELFLKLVTSGKISKMIPYNKLLGIWHKNWELNSVHLGVPSAILEIMIREAYRHPSKPEFTFSKAYNDNPKISQTDYYTANIREISSRNSVFSGLTFENFDQMANSSVNITKQKKAQTLSPVEKIIKM